MNHLSASYRNPYIKDHDMESRSMNQTELVAWRRYHEEGLPPALWPYLADAKVATPVADSCSAIDRQRRRLRCKATCGSTKVDVVYLGVS
jgi:hypothetical protein